MKKFITSLFIFISCLLNAQAPEWEWAKAAGTNSLPASMSIGKNESIYIAGNFLASDIVLGDSTTVYNNGFENIFIAKYDSLGNLVWANSAGGQGEDIATGITSDANGNCYVTGTAEDGLEFGTTDVSSGASNTYIYVVKFDSAGNTLWVKSAGTNLSNGNSQSLAITTDANGYSYIAGYFQGPSMNFGTVSITNPNNNYVSHTFVAKYSPTGNVVWAKSAGAIGGDGTNGNEGLSISIDESGNSYVAGVFEDSATSFGNYSFDNPGNFIVKYDSLGNVLWARTIVNPYSNYNVAISSDPMGNNYVAGLFVNDSVIIGSDTLRGSKEFNFFIARYDLSGHMSWAQSLSGSSQQENISAIGTDANGNCYVSGNPNPISDFFLSKYDSSGNAIWTKTPIGIYNEVTNCQSNGVSIDQSGNCFITGVYSDGPPIFGNDTLPLINNKDSYMFIAKIAEQISAGIEPVQSNSHLITIYPNPSTGQFYFKGVTEGSTITISNILGQTIYSSQVSGDNYMINLGNTAKGIYIYNVKSKSEEVQQGKIVLQ